MLEKARNDRVRMLLVTPEWQHAEWYPLLESLTVRSLIWRAKLYLSPTGELRQLPRFKTRFSLIDARPEQQQQHQDL